MTKISCPSLECIHNDGNGRCKAKTISFVEKYIATVHDGHILCWVCKQYEMDEQAKMITEKFKECLK